MTAQDDASAEDTAAELRARKKLRATKPLMDQIKRKWKNVFRSGTIEGKTYVVRDLTPEEVEAGEHVKLNANTYGG